jgi:hypothetical protein
MLPPFIVGTSICVLEILKSYELCKHSFQYEVGQSHFINSADQGLRTGERNDFAHALVHTEGK